MMHNSNPPNILFFKTETSGHPLGYSYVTIANDRIKIQDGDHLEYDIFIDITSPLSQAGLEMHFVSGRCMRESMIIDQNGMWSHPLTNLYDAVETWYHRQMDLSNLAGETVESVELAFVAPITGTYIACFKNITLTRNGEIVHSFYNEGEPRVFEIKMTLGYFNDVVKAIHWEDFRRVKIEHIDPMKISPEIQLAEKLLNLESDKKSKWQPLIEKAKAKLKIDKYVENDEQDFKQSLAEIDAILKPILKEVKSFTTHFIGHAHIDMNWLWVWNETVAVCHRDFETMTKLMQKYPIFTFSQSQVSIYKAVMKTRPDLFDRIRKFVNKGQWEVTAAMWVEGDENMAGGESLVRQFLLANRFLKHHFGIEPKVCWQPDLFGHVWTMPQILKKCGVKYYYFMRCGKDNPHVFWWEGPDGSRVLAATTPNYNGSIGHDTANYGFELYRKQGLKDYLHVYGVGDHGGGPTMRDIERGIEIGKNPSLPAVKFNTVANYFDTLASKYDNFPVIKDELQFIFEGCYTTHADIKLKNRQCENLFPMLEFFSVIAMPYELPYPEFILNEGWERACFNQFHDILPGSAIHASYEEAIPITDGFIEAGKQALQKSLTAIINQIHTSDINIEPIVVFNPNNRERNDVVTVQLPIFPDEWAEILDHEGNIIPSQIIRRTSKTAEIIFIANKIPSLGYKTFSWRKVDNAPAYRTDLSISQDFVIVNKFYQIKIDNKTGLISSLILKENNQEFIQPGKRANVFQLLHEDGREMSAWQIGNISNQIDLIEPERIEILEHGPVRILLQIFNRYNKSTFIQRVAIYSDLERIDFPCTVDWQEIGTRQVGSKFLKVAFALNLEGDAKATFELPFGTIAREPNGHEYPSQKWMDLGDSKYGVSLVNDCKFGCDIHKNVMRLSLLRCSYEPDPIPDKGIHDFRYAIIPYQGNWQTANTLKAGYELNQPLLPILTDQHQGTLPQEQAFVRCSADNIILTAFKKCEDDDSLILRFYEAYGATVDAAFEFSFKILQANETDLLERNLDNAEVEIKDDGFIIHVEPYEIKTIRLIREAFQWQKRHSFVPV